MHTTFFGGGFIYPVVYLLIYSNGIFIMREEGETAADRSNQAYVKIYEIAAFTICGATIGIATMSGGKDSPAARSLGHP